MYRHVYVDRNIPENGLKMPLTSYRKRANSINLPDFTVDMFSLTGTAPLSRVDDMDIIHTVSSCHVETVCFLSKLHETKHHVNVKLDMDEMDLTATES